MNERITIDDLASKMQCECKGKVITDHKGTPVFGKIVVVSLNNGKVVHGECGQDIDLVLRKTFLI